MSTADNSSANPVTALDAIIAEMDAQHAEARRILAGTHGAASETLAVALKTLEAKIQQARAKRDAIAARMQRADRMRELTAELQGILAELQPLQEAGGEDERVAQLRSRALGVRDEVEQLKAQR